MVEVGVKWFTMMCLCVCVCETERMHAGEILFSLTEECESHEALITTPAEKFYVCLCYSSHTHPNTQSHTVLILENLHQRLLTCIRVHKNRFCPG